jgi:hypothetical protein
MFKKGLVHMWHSWARCGWTAIEQEHVSPLALAGSRHVWGLASTGARFVKYVCKPAGNGGFWSLCPVTFSIFRVPLFTCAQSRKEKIVGDPPKVLEIIRTCWKSKLVAAFKEDTLSGREDNTCPWCALNRSIVPRIINALSRYFKEGP